MFVKDADIICIPVLVRFSKDQETGLSLWFYAIYLFSTSRHGVPAKELQRQLRVTYKCAWSMGHKIRKYMAEIDDNRSLSNEVEVDETYVGGKSSGRRGRGATGKSILFGMLEKGNNLVVGIVNGVKEKDLLPKIDLAVEQNSTIHSDEFFSYSSLSNRGYFHKTVKHSAKEFSKDGISVIGLEGFRSRLKNSIKGTHVHVSKKHLQSYSSEFAFRYNYRKKPEMMLVDLLACFLIIVSSSLENLFALEIGYFLFFSA